MISERIVPNGLALVVLSQRSLKGPPHRSRRAVRLWLAGPIYFASIRDTPKVRFGANVKSPLEPTR